MRDAENSEVRQQPRPVALVHKNKPEVFWHWAVGSEQQAACGLTGSDWAEMVRLEDLKAEDCREKRLCPTCSSLLGPVLRYVEENLARARDGQRNNYVRWVRVLEYIGPEDWLRTTLGKGGVPANGEHIVDAREGRAIIKSAMIGTFPEKI
jgi:hypothetical protein